MKTPGYWSEKLKEARSQETLIEIVKQIQADVLKSCGQFAFTEREFALSAQFGPAGDAILGTHFEIPDQNHQSIDR